ncbi:MAG: hypothetical protein C0592_06765 [Marinilabiliales bacterium]|nr:MAG: hypothetical protein C0592_06765 [Marinilabiliales bacterium]
MKVFSLLLVFGFLSAGAVFADNDHPEEPGNNPPPCHTATLTGTHNDCYGDSDGTVSLSISGGTGPFKIYWSTGDVDVYSLSNLPAGYYDVQVVDQGTGCVAFDIFNVTEPDELTSSHSHTDILCHGQNTGSIDLSHNGGTPGYSYTWADGPTTQDRNNIGAGTYYVTITDNNTCFTTDSVVLTEPAQAIDRTLISEDPSCFGFSDGWVDITVWGGTTPYYYNWSNTEASQDIDDLPSGTYTVTITDDNSCTSTISVTLTDPPQLTLGVTSTDNNCYGDILGSVDVTVGGGTLPYSYSWANSDYLLSWTEEDQDSLQNYMYYVTVTDANGCTLNDSAEVTSPDELQLSFTHNDVTTNGGSNGSINTNISGGVTPYLFSWSNGATTQNLTNIPAGWYILTVTDAHSCTIIDSVFIAEPANPLMVNLSATRVTCFGGSDGTVTAEAAGGTAPYTYLWSNGNTTTFIDSLPAGFYSITVTDYYSNTTSDTIEVLQPDNFVFTDTIIDVSCYGLSNGEIDVTITGGTSPYYYEWLNSDYVLAALTEDISNMPADIYTLLLEDTMGCKATQTFTINQPDELELDLTVTDAYCYDGSSGAISSTVAGGTPNYAYLWSTTDITADISNIPAGTYYLTVTDDHNCFKMDSAVVSQPDSIEIDYTTTPVSCTDQSDGTIIIYPNGGNGNYLYTWDNGETTAGLEGLIGGDYTVTVTDMMGCTGTETITVNVIGIDCITIPSSFTPNSDGINDLWTIDNAELYDAFEVTIFNRWGQEVFSSIGAYEGWDGTYNGEPMPATTYYYFIRLSADSPMMQGTVTIVR